MVYGSPWFLCICSRSNLENHEGFEFIYTDGSHIENSSAAAAVNGDHIYSERLPDHSTIFSAEMHAIFLALDHVETSESSQFLIFSDSKSVLQSLQGKDWKNPLTQKVLERHHRLRNQHKNIKFCWIPSHIGIDGNEAADTAAKEALGKRTTVMGIPYTDLKHKSSHMWDLDGRKDGTNACTTGCIAFSLIWETGNSAEEQSTERKLCSPESG